ncbi:MAG TPA: hydroxymethylbilane synthase [Solirubrobacteraceae bacterium]|jgi:hydroxymethylbilane synthase|nr:hydroxymethylbilane synthase [Solirubrobacteraceae bacterium]
MRIGTRRSALALAQAKLVADMLGGAELVPMLASGDADATSAEATAGSAPASVGAAPAAAVASDKSRWVAELEAALAAGEIDLAVHSAKDVPGELAPGLALLGAPARASAEDVLCGAAGLDELPAGARVGTSSIRRLAQLRAAREDLDVVAIRGNVDTRLRKLGDSGEGLDAIVLARAGLQRLGRESEAGGVLDVARFVPAPGQGTLALEGRSDDEPVREAVQAITDEDALACLLAERALARELDASCHTPLGAYAVPGGNGRLHVRAWIGLPDGSEWVGDELLGGFDDPEALGRQVAERLGAAGGAELLRRAEEMATA